MTESVPTVSVGKPATKSAQRAASVENLLGAALALFVSQGYRHTTVEQIAEAAGLTKGSVYFYFKSKDGLLHALLDGVEEIVVDHMVRRVSDAGPDAAAKIVAFVHGQATLGVTQAEHVLLLVLMSLEFGGQGEAIEARTRAIYDRLYRTLEDLIDFGKSRGEFRTDIRTREQAAIVMAGHDGTFLEWYRRSEDFNGEELVRALRTSTLRSLTQEQTAS